MSAAKSKTAKAEAPKAEAEQAPPAVSAFSGHAIEATLRCPACGATVAVPVPGLASGGFNLTKVIEATALGFLGAHEHLAAPPVEG
tara:strand:- start:214 stop:471 length:258 start_codon:yes stop_codon:yes gene_type:complete